jgi:hypothetical protein
MLLALKRKKCNMTNDEAMIFGLVVMVSMTFIVLYLIGKDNDK